MKHLIFSIVSSTAILLSTSAYSADIFIPEAPYVPPSPSLYMGFGAGYDALFGAATHGVQRTSPTEHPVRFASQRDGWFANAFIGWKANDDQAIISQAEIYSKLTGHDDHPAIKGSSQLYALTFLTPSGGANTPNLTGKPKLQQQHHLLELGARLKNGNAHDLLDTGGTSFGVEPFLAHMEQETASYVSTTGGFASRTGDIEAWIGGVNFSAETSFPVAEYLHAVFRASAGVYGVSSDARYAYSTLTVSDNYSDNKSTVGGRFGAEAKLVHVLSRNVTLAAVAGLDYWTAMPTAKMSKSVAAGPKVGTGLHDYMHVNAGLELTFAFGG